MTADLPKNSKETLRIARETFKGHELITCASFTKQMTDHCDRQRRVFPFG